MSEFTKEESDWLLADAKRGDDYRQGRLVMPHAGALSYAQQRARVRDMPGEVQALRAEVERLRAALTLVVNMGSDGRGEEGCPNCLKCEAYTVEMIERGEHVKYCFIDAALAPKEGT
jgi:hypothetical protein